MFTVELYRDTLRAVPNILAIHSYEWRLQIFVMNYSLVCWLHVLWSRSSAFVGSAQRRPAVLHDLSRSLLTDSVSLCQNGSRPSASPCWTALRRKTLTSVKSTASSSTRHSKYVTALCSACRVLVLSVTGFIVCVKTTSRPNAMLCLFTSVFPGSRCTDRQGDDLQRWDTLVHFLSVSVGSEDRMKVPLWAAFHPVSLRLHSTNTLQIISSYFYFTVIFLLLYTFTPFPFPREVSYLWSRYICFAS